MTAPHCGLNEFARLHMTGAHSMQWLILNSSDAFDSEGFCGPSERSQGSCVFWPGLVVFCSL